MAEDREALGLGYYNEIKRLIQLTDEMNRKMGQLVTDLALLQRDVTDLQRRFTDLEKRAPVPAPVTWQAWFLAGVALVAAASVLASLLGSR